MADIENLLLSCGFCDEVYYCWKVLLSHFIMAAIKTQNNNKKKMKMNVETWVYIKHYLVTALVNESVLNRPLTFIQMLKKNWFRFVLQVNVLPPFFFL